MENPGVYIPIDRLHALAAGRELPERTRGAGLFADISGFTPLTEAIVRELGATRGAEELTRHLNAVYDTLIAELYRYGGSVISFSGDAITCWFDELDDSRLAMDDRAGQEAPPSPGAERPSSAALRAAACAQAMQRSMRRFASVATPGARTVSLAMKVSVAAGAARRFVVGDPQIQLIDVLAGALMDRLAAGERLAHTGEVLLDAEAVAALGGQGVIKAWCEDDQSKQRFGSLSDEPVQAVPAPWAPVPMQRLSEAQLKPWLLPHVYERLASGQGEFLAELRPAVMMFVNFGGIDYDADDAAGAKLDAFVRTVQRVLVRYGGTLLQMTIGDKGSYLYAAFGVPQAHEDDAARAVSAALELRASELDAADTIQIGISHGRARTGAYGGSARRTYGVIGEAVNLAARLMQAAAPGQILVSQVVRQSADGFIWEALPEIRVKGRAQPVAIFSPIRARERRTLRLGEARYALPMVGRRAELARVEERMRLVLRGQGQIIGICGEAGAGKSRLVAEIIRMAQGHGMVGVGGGCESYGTNTSYLVWHTIWQGFFGVDVDQPPEDIARTIEAHLAAIDTSLAPRAPLLGAALNVALPENDLTASLDAKLRKASLESLLVECLRARARRTPILLVLEDCHWLDPLSHDLIDEIGRAIAQLPVLMVLAYRPLELQRLQAPRVSALPHYTEIVLPEFTADEAEELIRLKLDQIYGTEASIPPGFAARIMARSQGNPFYVEELLNYLKDRNIDPHDTAALEQIDLPSSLHTLILSRIDQLTESQKITLKIASIIGRLFRAAVLWDVYPQLDDPERIKGDLEALSRLELTLVDVEPELTYLFKHILTQEVAYESLPFAMRALLHDQIGQSIERRAGDAIDQYVDLLAFHFSRSPNVAKQRLYLLKAAEAARADYANDAAIDYYQRVLPLLPDQERVEPTRVLGQVYELVSKWDEAAECYRQALALAEQLGDVEARGWCETATGELLRKRGRFAEAAEWQERALASFQAAGARAGVAQVLHYRGTLAAQQGKHDAARALYEESLQIRRELDDKPSIGSLLSNLGIVARFQGDLARARALHEEGLAIRRAVGNRWAIANSLNNLGNVLLDQGDFAAARGRLEEAVALLRQIGDRWAIANSLNNLGNVARTQGDVAAARRLYEESLLFYRELGDRWALAYLLEDMGGLAAQQGRAERALRLVGAAAVLREAIGAPLSAAEQARLAQLLEPATAALDPGARAAAEAAGREMSMEAAIAYALDDLEEIAR